MLFLLKQFFLFNQECSGIHRSLGSHLSKVRSLMLDRTSYTPEVVNMLLALGNARSNSIWDPRKSSSSASPNDEKGDDVSTRPTSKSSRDDKVAYIFAKYRDKSYVQSIENKNPQMLLLEAIEKDDLVLANHAFALGADPNVPHTASTLTLFTSSSTNENNDEQEQKSKFISLPVLDADGEQVPDKFLQFPVPEPFTVRYPLHFALLKKQNNTHHDIEDNSISTDFIMAEFLFQNGADPSIVDPYNGYPLSELIGIGYAVDDSALMYFNQKITARGSRRVWRTSINSTSSTSPPCKKS